MVILMFGTQREIDLLHPLASIRWDELNKLTSLCKYYKIILYIR